MTVNTFGFRCVVQLYFVYFCTVFCIVNRGNPGNSTFSENHIYRPPLDPSLFNGDEDEGNKYPPYQGPKFSNEAMLFCGNVPVVNNAISNMYSIKEQRSPVNTVATYNCVNGYKKINGSEKLRCVVSSDTKTAIWETPTLKCQIVDCGDPGYVEHATRQAFKFTFNETVIYTCHPGYQPEGPPFIICAANGRWNRPRPKCKLIQCPKIPVNDTTTSIDYNNNSLVNGTIATIKCKFGYKFNQSQKVHTRVCQWSGSWSENKLPQCVPAYCDPINRPHLALLIKPYKERYVMHTVVMITCLTLKTNNKLSSVCLADGWSREPMYCPAPRQIDLYCPAIGDFPNGSHNGSKGRQKTGTKIFFKCNNSNFLLNGAPWIYCQADGTWTGQVPSCSVKSTSVSIERTSSKLTVLLTCIVITFVLIILIVSILLLRWRQRQLQRRHWRRYFGNHTYRQSKTNIYHNNQEMKLFKQSKSQAVPVTDL